MEGEMNWRQGAVFSCHQFSFLHLELPLDKLGVVSSPVVQQSIT